MSESPDYNLQIARLPGNSNMAVTERALGRGTADFNGQITRLPNSAVIGRAQEDKRCSVRIRDIQGNSGSPITFNQNSNNSPRKTDVNFNGPVNFALGYQNNQNYANPK